MLWGDKHRKILRERKRQGRESGVVGGTWSDQARKTNRYQRHGSKSRLWWLRRR